MGFSLQAVDADGSEHDEFLSLSNRAMADLREVVGSVAGGKRADTLAKFMFNDGKRIGPEECHWIARQLRAADRAAIGAREPEPADLFGLMDELERFCERCAGLGGFEVW